MTGSVDDRMEPNMSASTALKRWNSPTAEPRISTTPMTTVDSTVPRNAYTQMLRKLSKNGRRSIE